MPVLSLETLHVEPEAKALATALASQDRGLVLSTGPDGSGKQTILLALALHIAGGRPVHFLIENDTQLAEVFQPAPEGWTYRQLQGPEFAAEIPRVPKDALLVLSSITDESAQAAMAASAQRLVLASLDSPYLGLDVAYTLNGMGVPYETFAEQVRLVWSQFLPPLLCPECARPAVLPEAEAAALFPDGQVPAGARQEAGCPACQGTGLKGRTAVYEVLLVDDASREGVRNTVLRGSPLTLPAGRLLRLDQLARAMLARGEIGLRTWRDRVRRHPLLRGR